jgi:hypothetical protein
LLDADANVVLGGSSASKAWICGKWPKRIVARDESPLPATSPSELIGNDDSGTDG